MKRSLFSLIVVVAFLMSCSKDSPSSSNNNNNNNNTPTYSKVYISKVSLLGVSSSDANGYYWDAPIAGNYPDVYWKLREMGSTTILYYLSTDNRLENCTNSILPYVWLTPNLYFTDFSKSIAVDLLDYDNTVGVDVTDDLMATVYFNLSDYAYGNNKYPATATVTSGANIVKLDFIWTN